MAKVTAKKALTYVGMGAAALVVTGGLVYMASPTPPNTSSNQASPATSMTQSSDSTDTFGDFSQASSEVPVADEAPVEVIADIEEVAQANLDRLREREAELSAVYEGSEASQYRGEDSDRLITETVGDFSSFDRHQPATREDAEPDPATLAQPDEAVEDEWSAEPEPAINDQSVFGAIATQDGEDVSWDQSYPMDVDRSLTESLSTERIPFDDMTLHSLEGEIENLRVQLDEQVDVRFTEMADAVEALQASVATIGDRFSRVEARVTEMSAGSGVDERLDEALISLEQRLNERIKEVEAARQSAASRGSSSRAAPVNVANLYRLSSIGQRGAVLVGQNTGKVYELNEGDSLAYGGTVTQIAGDSVTLSWPNRTLTLSVFE